MASDERRRGFNDREADTSADELRLSSRYRRLTEEEDEEEREDPLRPSARRVLAQTTALCWDYLGLTFLGSFSTLVALSLFWLALPPGLFGPSLLLGIVRIGLLFIPAYALMAGPAHLAHQMMLREDPSPRDLLHGWKQYGGKAAVLGVFNGVAWTLLAGDIAFFLAQPNPLLQLMAAPFAYVFLLWAAAQIYVFPLMLMQGFSPLRALKQAHLLALANPVFTGLLALVMGILGGATLFTWALAALFLPVWLAEAGMVAMRALLRKYNAMTVKE